MVLGGPVGPWAWFPGRKGSFACYQHGKILSCMEQSRHRQGPEYPKGEEGEDPWARHHKGSSHGDHR